MSDFKIMLYSPEEEYEESAALWLQAFGWKKIVKLPPWLFPGAKVTEKYLDNRKYQRLVQRAYGFWYSSDDYFLQIKYGIQDEDDYNGPRHKTWSYFIPWLSWRHVRHTIHGPRNWEFVAELEGISWPDREKAIASCPKITYQIQDFDGEIIDATAYLEEMEWRRGCGRWKWVSYFTPSKIRRSIDISYAAEVGLQKGSWKGGTTGHGVDVESGESIVESLARLYADPRYYRDTVFLKDTVKIQESENAN